MEKPRRTLALEMRLSQALRTRPRRVVALLVAVLLATLLLASLKWQGGRERTQLAAVQALTAQQQAAAAAQVAAYVPQQWGGASTNKTQSALVARVALALTSKSDAGKANPPLHFHLMAEANSLNIYALGGEIYLTTALLNRMQTEGQLAAAMAHAAAHALAHDGLTAVAQATPLWQYSVSQEQLADMLTVKLMGQAGYDPHAFARMLMVLAKAYHDGADVAFFTTHPNMAERLTVLDATIAALYPQGVSQLLSK